MKWWEKLLDWKTLLALILIYIVITQGVKYNDFIGGAAKVADKVSIKK